MICLIISRANVRAAVRRSAPILLHQGLVDFAHLNAARWRWLGANKQQSTSLNDLDLPTIIMHGAAMKLIVERDAAGLFGSIRKNDHAKSAGPRGLNVITSTTIR